MNLCYSCFKEIEKAEFFCRNCQVRVFNRQRVTPLLGFDKKEYIDIKHATGDHFSISGVQDKISLKIENNNFVPVEKGGEYILKPVPQTIVPQFQNDIPANEHLTMQIAKQIFKISTAENALLRFSDNEPAYIVKRFDVTDKGKLHQEDFCQLLEISEESHGKNYKYDSSYEKGTGIIDKFCSAAFLQKERFLNIIIFNYLFSNGDAHFKNFSLIETPQGDFVLSPLYDALATSIHYPNEARTALDLFNDFETESFKINGFYTREDFLEFSNKAGLKMNRIDKFIKIFFSRKKDVVSFIEKSFMSKKAKEAYRDQFEDRLKAIQ